MGQMEQIAALAATPVATPLLQVDGLCRNYGARIG